MPETETQNVTMNVDDEINNTVQKPKGETTQPESKNVNVNLLNNIRSILEISTARGTFKATELTAIGQVYDELTKLLQ